MSATDDIARERQKFYVRLSDMISEKRKKKYAFFASRITRKISFALVIFFAYVYVIVNLFATLQTHTQ